MKTRTHFYVFYSLLDILVIHHSLRFYSVMVFSESLLRVYLDVPTCRDFILCIRYSIFFWISVPLTAYTSPSMQSVTSCNKLIKVNPISFTLDFFFSISYGMRHQHVLQLNKMCCSFLSVCVVVFISIKLVHGFFIKQRDEKNKSCLSYDNQSIKWSSAGFFAHKRNPMNYCESVWQWISWYE